MKVPATIVNLTRQVTNLSTSRMEWLRRLLSPSRSIENECGHPDTVDLKDYSKLFARGDVAKRVVTILPDETWALDPVVYETEEEAITVFEQAWMDMLKPIPVFSFLHRADVLSGIGRFGILIIGIDDGKQLHEPIEGLNEKGEAAGTNPATRKLLYLRSLEEDMVKVSVLESDQTNPRFGLPKEYEVNFVDPKQFVDSTPTGADGKSPGPKKVHWHRVIHLADNRTNNEVYGSPRMEVVYNRLLDLKKVAGGSGEMFWKGGFPGLSFETHPNLSEDITVDKEVTKKELENYMNGLQRYLVSENMTAKSLTVQVADPTAHVDTQLKLIGIAMGIPWRILAGSEAAQLASEQDSKAWSKKLTYRREAYLCPFVLRPFIDRLILIGVLPNPKEGYTVAWGDTNNLNTQQGAKIAETKTNAMARYVQAGADALMPPFHFFTLVLGYSDTEAKAIIAAAEDHIPEVLDRKVEEAKALGKVEADLAPKQTGVNAQPTSTRQTSPRK